MEPISVAQMTVTKVEDMQRITVRSLRSLRTFMLTAGLKISNYDFLLFF